MISNVQLHTFCEQPTTSSNEVEGTDAVVLVNVGSKLPFVFASTFGPRVLVC